MYYVSFKNLGAGAVGLSVGAYLGLTYETPSKGVFLTYPGIALMVIVFMYVGIFDFE